MKKTILLSVVITLALVFSVMGIVHYVMQGSWKPRPEGTPTAVPAGEGWMDLLSEQYRSNWRNIKDDMEIFEMDGDMLHIFGKSLGTLRYVGYGGRTFSDFELHLEFKLARRTNSGVFLRAQENDPVYRGFEIQVIEDNGKAPSYTSCGSIYDVASPMFNMSRPAGEWNSYDITARGQNIIVYMNGWKVIDADLSKMTSLIGKFEVPFAELPLDGLIALQDHGGEAWFRNIVIRPIETATVESVIEPSAAE